MTYSFWDNDQVWDSTRRNLAKQGIQALNTGRDYDGSWLVNVSDIGDNSYTWGVYPDVFIQLKDTTVGSNGSSECDLGASIWINKNKTSYTTTNQFYWQVPTHEMMHLAGAEHAGWYNERTGVPPRMATCGSSTLPVYRNSAALTLDDEAHLQWLHGKISDRQLNANVGFEKGSVYWSVTSGPVSYKSSGGDVGPGYLQWTSPNANNALFQESVVMTGDDDEVYVGRASVRSPGSSYKATARVRVYTRSITYGGNNSCDYADGLDAVDPNQNPTPGGWVLRADSGSVTVGTAWGGVQTPVFNPPTTHAFIFSTQLLGVATNSSGNGPLHVDNLRTDGT